MGLFDKLFGRNKTPGQVGVIPGGKQKQDGSHDHRTPAQKEGDKKSGKD